MELAAVHLINAAATCLQQRLEAVVVVVVGRVVVVVDVAVLASRRVPGLTQLLLGLGEAEEEEGGAKEGLTVLAWDGTPTLTSSDVVAGMVRFAPRTALLRLQPLRAGGGGEDGAKRRTEAEAADRTTPSSHFLHLSKRVPHAQ